MYIYKERNTHPFGLGQLDLPTCPLTQVMKEIFMQTGVLQVIRCHLLLAFDLDANMKPYSTRHG